MELLNIGIFAHVDAGKTTLTENILHKAGVLRHKGNVNDGSAATDYLEVEQKRGISVRSAAVSFTWKDTRINLIDTPGHADFTAEVERTLAVVDAAVLLVSAVEGVQSHTYAIWEALKEMNKPVMVVINKIDRPGADVQKVLQELQQELNMVPFLMHSPEQEGTANATITELWKNDDLLCDAAGLKNMALENLAQCDENILEKYLEGEVIPHDKIMVKLKNLANNGTLQPVLITVAKADVGTQQLLDALNSLIITPYRDTKGEPSALVYKIEHDKSLGRMGHVKVFSGILQKRMTIENVTQGTMEKIAQIKRAFAQKLEDTEKLLAGDIGVISGMPEIKPGDILGSESGGTRLQKMQVPVITVQVRGEKEEDYPALAEALGILNAEDPSLNFQWFKAEKELHLKLMGVIQQEILQQVLLERFGVRANMVNPTVIYKESPKDEAAGFARYTMPKPCWAVVKFHIEPGKTGSGISYSSEVSVDKVARKYQNEVEQTIPKALQQGIKGWEVTDIKITLIDGEDHEIHSRPGDFILATPMALMKALQASGTQLLEPIYAFKIKAGEEHLGKITSDITTMRGTFESPEFNETGFVLKGSVPVATAMDYPIAFNSLTGGKGKLRFKLDGYQPCTDEQGQIRTYTGVNPLDESQWILHHRGAFKAEDRKF